MYQRSGTIAFKTKLDNSYALDAYLGHPHHQFKSIHVAGTNGKGSTSHMLASVFQEAGYKVGLYTSPHLKDFRERIKVNGQPCPTDYVVDFVDQHQEFLIHQQLSFFEMTVGMAFDYFAIQEVDIAVIEVGLGGRLDSTNIITPVLSVITNIGWDHMNMLGNSLEAIAAEKAGIIKDEIPVVIGESLAETRAVFEHIANERKAPIHFAEAAPFYPHSLDLKGSYQKYNARTAFVTLEILKNDGWEIEETHIEKGLSSVVKNTGLMGRWQWLSHAPNTVCDTAHNKEGLQQVMRQLQEEDYHQLHLVLGVVNDKDLDAILPLFPRNGMYYFCRPDIPRGLEAEKLSEAALSHGLKGDTYRSVQSALQAASKAAGPRDLIYVGGSTFTVAEVV